jgi:hypothetical protein
MIVKYNVNNASRRMIAAILTAMQTARHNLQAFYNYWEDPIKACTAS